MGHIVVFNEPLIILLKDTISDTIAEPIDESIESRFGRCCLPTTVKDLQKIITDHSNFVAMESHNRLTSFLIEVNRSVARLPGLVVSNCLIHLGFDLAHERSFPLTLIEYTKTGTTQPTLCHFVDWHKFSMLTSQNYHRLSYLLERSSM